jgi:hypothetical protein
MTSVAPATGAATVTWSAPLGATGYDVYYDSTSSHSGSTTLVDATHPYPSSTTNVTSGGTGNVGSSLSAGTTYYFRVAAKNSSGYLLSTNELSSVVYQSLNFDIPFNTLNSSTNYSLSDASRIEITSPGIVRLKPADQTDDSTSSDTTHGFMGGTPTPTTVQWDSTKNVLRLNTATNNSELDASWTPQWGSLVGYWKLNEASGTTANDSSGNAHSGTITTGVGFSSSCVFGNCFSFSGTANTQTTDVIDFGNVTATNFGTGNFSISFWLSTTNTSAMSIITKRSICSHESFIDMSMASSGKINFEVDGGTSGTGYDSLMSTKAINDGTLHHFIAIRSASKKYLYIDGSLNASVTLGTIANISNSSNLKIGGSPCSAVGAITTLNGKLDDVAIWNTALTATEIAAIYGRQSAKYSGQVISRVFDAWTIQPWTSLAATTTLPFYKELPSNTAAEPATSGTTAVYSDAKNSIGGSAGSATTSSGISTGLVGLWHLNEASGTTGAGSIKDSSGNANNATPTSVTMGSLGILNSAASFDGTSSYISIPDSTSLSLNSSNKVTASAWVRFNGWYSGACRTNQVLGKSVDGSSVGYYGLMVQDSGGCGGAATGIHRTTFNVSAGGAVGYTKFIIGGSDLKLGQWYHLVGIYDGSKLDLYVNGVSDATSVVVTGAIGTNTAPLTIGKMNSASYPYYANGSIDEVAIWNRALSASEVLDLYRRGANRIKYQVRSCSTTADCDSTNLVGWKGPDNTSTTYFSELYNTTGNALGAAALTGSPTMTLNNFTGTPPFLSNNQYFQYRAILESDDTNGTDCSYGGTNNASCSPELQSVFAGPNRYDTTIQSIVSSATIGSTFQTLSGFTESLGSNGCSQGARYTVSRDGATYYYWDLTANAGSGGWSTSSNSYTTASPAADLTAAHIAAFPTAIGTGTLQVKTYLKSDGNSPCEINNLHFDGQKY